MEIGKSSPSRVTNPCTIPSLSGYPTKYPTHSSFSKKNFQNAVNLHPQEKSPCKNTWYRDVKSTHIRNKHLLDLTFERPKCCTEIFNIMQDRLKLKKLKKYGLTRPVRTVIRDLEMEEVERCIPVPEEGEKIVCYPECYLPPESSSEEEDDEDSEYEVCLSGSVSQCSGCSTLGGGTRRKMHKVIKKDWRELLHSSELKLCQDTVDAEISKHTMGQKFGMNLDKV